MGVLGKPSTPQRGGRMRETDLDVCGNCRFWSNGTNQPRNSEVYAEGGGECRKYPPRGGLFHVYQKKQSDEHHEIVSIVSFPFPPTHQLDWCGEYEAIHATP